MADKLFWSTKSDSPPDKLCISPSIEKLRYDAIESKLTDDELKQFHAADKEIVDATTEIICNWVHISKNRARDVADSLVFAAVNGRQGIIEGDKSRPVETFGDAVKFINDHLPYI